MKNLYFYVITTMLTLLLGAGVVYAQTVPIRNGGTNNTTYPTNSLIYFDGSQLTATSSQPLYIGSLNATTTATSTFSGGVDMLAFNLTGSATSTATNGIDLTGGCFSIAGTCVGGTSQDPVTLAGAYDYLTLSGQEITLNQIDLTTDVTGTLPIANGGTNKTTYSLNSLLYYDGTSITATSSQPLYVGAINATTTATSTFSGGVNLLAINQTGSATSTFTNGIDLAGGCFSVAGTCVTGGGGGTPGGSDSQVQYNNGGSFGGDSLFVWDDTNKRLGIGTSTPYAMLSVAGHVVGEYFTATSSSATSTLSGGVNFGEFDTKYEVGTNSLFVDNLYSGPEYFDSDAGIVSWVDVPVTSSASDGTVQSYTASIDGNPVLTVYGEADGSGGADTFRVGIGTTTPYSKLSVAGQVVGQNFVATSTTANTFGGALLPLTDDVAALGSTSFKWSDLFVASGAVINFDSGDVTITHASNALTFAGASAGNGYQFDQMVAPTTDDGAALGSTSKGWADLFVASGAVINFNNGDVTLTHSSNTLTLGGGDLALGTNDVTTGGEVQLDGTPDADHTAVGDTTNTFNAGTTVTIMDLVYMATDGEWALTDADDTATSTSMMAISLAAGTDGNPMNVALSGSFVRDDTWTWTPGDILYVSTTPGAITATAPSGTDDVVRVVGHAVSADVIYFDPSNDWLTLE